jgi:starvation-inducible DNA-binding protein
MTPAVRCDPGETLEDRREVGLSLEANTEGDVDKRKAAVPQHFLRALDSPVQDEVVRAGARRYPELRGEVHPGPARSARQVGKRDARCKMGIDVVDDPLQTPLRKGRRAATGGRQIAMAAHAEEPREDGQAERLEMERDEVFLDTVEGNKRLDQTRDSGLPHDTQIDNQDLVRSGFVAEFLQTFEEGRAHHVEVHRILLPARRWLYRPARYRNQDFHAVEQDLDQVSARPHVPRQSVAGDGRELVHYSGIGIIRQRLHQHCFTPSSGQGLSKPPRSGALHPFYVWCARPRVGLARLILSYSRALAGDHFRAKQQFRCLHERPGADRMPNVSSSGRCLAWKRSHAMNDMSARERRVAPLGTPSDLGTKAIKDLSTSLTTLLADVFALYVKTKNFHWHMSGSHFRDYHLLLDDQGDQIFAMTDAIAERVRKIGGTTLRSISHIGRLQRLLDNDAEFVSPSAMLAELRDDNRQLTAYMRETHALCDEHNDVATASLLENWIDESERRTWFLFETTR